MKRLARISARTGLSPIATVPASAAAVIAALAFAALPSPASAQTPAPAPPAQTGYVGPSSVPLMSVRQLLAEGKDDQAVTLRGKLLRHIGGDRYVFADSTGEMQVDIDKRVFPMGQTVGANDNIEITGEFEKEWIGTSELDVKQLRILGAN